VVQYLSECPVSCVLAAGGGLGSSNDQGSSRLSRRREGWSDSGGPVPGGEGGKCGIRVEGGLHCPVRFPCARRMTEGIPDA
jgi:hypothetical protein